MQPSNHDCPHARGTERVPLKPVPVLSWSTMCFCSQRTTLEQAAAARCKSGAGKRCFGDRPLVSKDASGDAPFACLSRRTLKKPKTKLDRGYALSKIDFESHHHE